VWAKLTRWLAELPEDRDICLSSAVGLVILAFAAAPLLLASDSVRTEASELGLAALPFDEAIRAMRMGAGETASPLGHVLVRSASLLGVVSARIVSFLAGAISVIAIGLAARSFFGRWEGRVAVVVAATTPVVALVAGSAGSGAIFLSLSTLSLLFWYRGLTGAGGPAWPGYIVCSAAMLYAHHLGVLLLVAQTAAVGVDAFVWSVSRHRTRRSHGGSPYAQYLFSVALVFGLFLPWALTKGLFPQGHVESSRELVTLAPFWLLRLFADLTTGLIAPTLAVAVLLSLAVRDGLRRRKSSGPGGRVYVDTSHRRPTTLLGVTAIVFLPGAVATSFASRIPLRAVSLIPLTGILVVGIARGLTALGVRRWVDSGWTLTRVWVPAAATALLVGINVAGLVSRVPERLAGGTHAVRILREFFAGAVGQGDLVAARASGDLPGLVASAAGREREVTIIGSRRPGENLAQAPSVGTVWFLTREPEERWGKLVEYVVAEKADRVCVIDVGTAEARSMLGPNWSQDLQAIPGRAPSRAQILARRGRLTVRLSETRPNVVAVHLFTREEPQIVSLTVNGTPCKTVSLRQGWSTVTIPADERLFRRNTANKLVLHFSRLNPGWGPSTTPFSAAVDLVLLERRYDPVTIMLRG
jgi:hypothetical protein